MDFGLSTTVEITRMKIIVGISAIAVLGAALIYNVQNNENAESEKIAKVSEATPVAEVLEQSPNELDESSNTNTATIEDVSLVESEAEVKNPVQSSMQKEIVVTPKKVIANKKAAAKKAIVIAAAKPKTILDDIKTTQSATNKTEIELKKSVSKTKKSKFSQTLDVTLNTDNKETSDGEKGYDTQLWYFLNYKINDTYNARLWVDITKDLAESYEEKLNNTKVTISHKSYKFTDKLKMSPSITTIFPTSEKSKRNEELIVGFEFNTSFSYQVTDKLRLSYLPRFAKNFHEYKTSRTNAMNTEYKSVQFYTASYELTEKWSTTSTLIYVNTWSYEGSRRSPSYLTILDLGYQVNKSLSLAMGTMQGGSVFDRASGPDETIKVLDKNETTLYGNFALRF